jgi:hypothetical protein
MLTVTGVHPFVEKCWGERGRSNYPAVLQRQGMRHRTHPDNVTLPKCYDSEGANTAWQPMHRMKRKSEATSRGNFLLHNQFDLDMLRVTIEVGRDLDELMQMIGVARSDAYRMLEVPAFSPPLLFN